MTAPAVALEPAGVWKPIVTIRYSRAGRPRNAAIRPPVLRPFHATQEGRDRSGEAAIGELPAELHRARRHGRPRHCVHRTDTTHGRAPGTREIRVRWSLQCRATISTSAGTA